MDETLFLMEVILTWRLNKNEITQLQSQYHP